MNGRILWIELRRNELLLLFPVVMLLYGFGTWESVLNLSVVFWVENSVEARNSVALLGPFAGVVAAWMTGRDRRRGLDDLIATTPRPALSRDLTVWAATALLGIAAYAVVAAVILGRTALRASWDGPYLSILVPGFCTIVAMAAIGYPIGRILPRRVTAILVGAGSIILIALPITVWDSWLGYLSPAFAADTPLSAWWGVQPNIALAQSIFLLGVACLGLAGIAAVSRARRVALPVLLVAIVTAAVGIGTIRSGVHAAGEPEIAAYDPACAGDAVMVCVHPAFEGVLDDLVAGTEVIIAPFVGLEGVPTRLDQQAPRPPDDSGGVFSDVMSGEVDGAILAGPGFSIEDPVDVGAVFVALNQITAQILGPPPMPDGQDTAAWEARLVIRLGLLQAAGYDLTCNGDEMVESGLLSSSSLAYHGVSCSAFERFVALNPATRNEWLRQNYEAIRAGEITLEDLP
ncbi:MAG: hypothetical protein ACRDJH_05425 [Thermomicrobiales bacterium]